MAGEQSADDQRQWLVAGGVVLDETGRVLLVENRRKNGGLDWSTPGGVIDEGENLIEGLTREVEEETGLRVAGWTGPLYQIEVDAPGFFFLRVEAHQATSVEGTIEIDDPDGIVIGARYLALDEAIERLSGAPRWVGEPLIDQLRDGVADGRLYRYRMIRSADGERVVERL